MELAGLGALMALLEERRKKLAAEGLFDAARKKKLPFLPEVIGVVTSPTGAVIRDIMHRLEARFPRRVLLWPVAVQGEKAAAEIAAAIAGFNAFDGTRLPRPDLIIVARGGGSVEDLMAFNDEAVVRAAAASVIPLISAVGHETDTTLIDFAADMRAPTPTAAAELAVPVRSELLAQTLDFERRILSAVSARRMEDRRVIWRSWCGCCRAPRACSRVRASGWIRRPTNCSHALRRNLQIHQAAFQQGAARGCATGCCKDRMAVCGERLAVLARTRQPRAERPAGPGAPSPGWAGAGAGRDFLSRRCWSAALPWCGARTARCAAARAPSKAGEALTLTFADGEARAAAGEARAKPKARARNSPPIRARFSEQGSLF